MARPPPSKTQAATPEPQGQDQAIAGFLATIPLFAEVTLPEAMDVMRLLRRVDLTAGEGLFEQGDPPGAMWVLGEGCVVEVSATREAGAAPVILATLKKGDTLGEMALIDDSPRSATAKVKSGGQAQRIEAADFEALRVRYHPAAYKMLRRLAAETARRLRTICERIAPDEQSFAGAEGAASQAVEAAARVTPEALEGLPQFKGLPSTVRLALAQKLKEQSYARDALLFCRGDPSDSAFILVEGELALRLQDHPMAKLSPGSMFGLISAVDGGPRAADCRAATDARVLRLAREDFDWLFHSGNRFAYQIVDLVARQMVSRLRQLNGTLLVQCSELPRAAQAATDAHKAHGALAGADIDIDIAVWLDDA